MNHLILGFVAVVIGVVAAIGFLVLIASILQAVAG